MQQNDSNAQLSHWLQYCLIKCYIYDSPGPILLASTRGLLSVLP